MSKIKEHDDEDVIKLGQQTRPVVRETSKVLTKPVSLSKDERRKAEDAANEASNAAYNKARIESDAKAAEQEQMPRIVADLSRKIAALEQAQANPVAAPRNAAGQVIVDIPAPKVPMSAVGGPYTGPFALSVSSTAGKIHIADGQFMYGDTLTGYSNTDLDPVEYSDGTTPLDTGYVYACVNVVGALYPAEDVAQAFCFCSSAYYLAGDGAYGCSHCIRLGRFTADNSGATPVITGLWQEHYGDIISPRYSGPFSTYAASNSTELHVRRSFIQHGAGSSTNWESPDRCTVFPDQTIPSDAMPSTFRFVLPSSYDGTSLTFSFTSNNVDDTAQENPPPFCVGHLGGMGMGGGAWKYGPNSGPKVFYWKQIQIGNMYMPVIRVSGSWAVGYRMVVS